MSGHSNFAFAYFMGKEICIGMSMDDSTYDVQYDIFLWYLLCFIYMNWGGDNKKWLNDVFSVIDVEI